MTFNKLPFGIDSVGIKCLVATVIYGCIFAPYSLLKRK